MCHAASDDFGHRAATQRLRAQLAAQLQRRVDAQSGADAERGERGDVERTRWDYVRQLENQLAVKTGLLDEALRLHRLFHGRLVSLSEGLTWKDQQLEQLARSERTAWRQAEKDTQEMRQWRRRAESLEEENTALRDELRESSENNLRLRQFLDVLEVQAVKGYGLRSRTFSQQFPTEETKFEQTRRVSEEQLPPAAPLPALIRATPGESAAKLSFFLTPQEAWAQVGSSASDRLCGVNLERLKVDEPTITSARSRLDRVDEAKVAEEAKEETKQASISSTKEVLEISRDSGQRSSANSPKKRGNLSSAAPPVLGAPHPRPVRYMSATQLSALAAVPAAGAACGSVATMAGDARVSPAPRWPPSPTPAAQPAQPQQPQPAVKPKAAPLLPLPAARHKAAR
ncbi:unnamed protein product [Cladocopium goreaui]|uniref:Copia protein n=1 Tax=Cladocopium goreaui TaxID=2562237 RepID=A0A9P1C9V1_9DINO|nr:unnamed protein product [Cladocopium goreaui]